MNGTVLGFGIQKQGWLVLTTAGLYSLGNSSMPGLGLGQNSYWTYSWKLVNRTIPNADKLVVGGTFAMIYTNYDNSDPYVPEYDDDDDVLGLILGLTCGLLPALIIIVVVTSVCCCKKRNLNPKPKQAAKM